MNELTFPLLAALASVQENSGESLEQKEALEALGRLRQTIEAALPKMLDESRYMEKSRLRASIGHALDDATLLAACPELVNRTCVVMIMAEAHISQVKKLFTDGDSDLREFSSAGNMPWDWPLQMPQLLIHAEENPHAQIMTASGGFANLYENVPDHDSARPLWLAPDEYGALAGLAADGIEPANMATALAWFAPLSHAHAAYLLIRPQDIRTPDIRRLMLQCESAVICGALHDEECLDAMATEFHMPVYFLGGDRIDVETQTRRIAGSFIGRKVEILSYRNLEQFFERHTGYIERVTVRDRIHSELLALLEDSAKRVQSCRQLKTRIHSFIDSTADIRHDLDGKLRQVDAKNTELIDNLSESLRRSREGMNRILEAAEAFEKTMLPFKSDVHGWHAPWLNCGEMRPETVWRRIVLRCLSVGDTATAALYQAKYAQLFPEPAHITKMYIDYMDSGAVSGNALERLRHMPDSQEVFRAKIFFRNALGLTAHDCAEIASLMKRPQSADEKYAYAAHLREAYDNARNKNCAQQEDFEALLAAMWDAILAGSEDAAEDLAMYCASERLTEEALKIASTGNPAACYVVALLYTLQGNEEGRRLFMNMGAASGHLDAMRAMAEDLWKPGQEIELDVKAESGSGIFKPRSGSRLADIMAFFKFLAQLKGMGAKIPYLHEKLGFCYFCFRQWADSAGNIGGSPATSEGNLALAVMSRHGYGVVQDNDMAVKYILKAADGGGQCGKYAARLKDEWYEQDLKKINNE